ncbi:MAG: rod shape-determining protein MreD [Aliishimia sp.]
MSDTSGLRMFMMRSAFVLLALCILLGNILPLQTLPRGWGGPDVLLGFALAWSVRRPDYVPLGLLAVVFLTADFLLQRPPGLAAALMLLAVADLQTRTRILRDAGFAAEWARAALLIVGIAIVQHTVLFILLVDVPSLGLLIFQTALTAAIYPICVALSAGLMGVRMTSPGDLDGFGQRT